MAQNKTRRIRGGTNTMPATVRTQLASAEKKLMSSLIEESPKSIEEMIESLKDITEHAFNKMPEKYRHRVEAFIEELKINYEITNNLNESLTSVLKSFDIDLPNIINNINVGEQKAGQSGGQPWVGIIFSAIIAIFSSPITPENLVREIEPVIISNLEHVTAKNHGSLKTNGAVINLGRIGTASLPPEYTNEGTEHNLLIGISNGEPHAYITSNGIIQPYTSKTSSDIISGLNKTNIEELYISSLVKHNGLLEDAMGKFEKKVLDSITNRTANSINSREDMPIIKHTVTERFVHREKDIGNITNNSEVLIDKFKTNGIQELIFTLSIEDLLKQQYGDTLTTIDRPQYKNGPDTHNILNNYIEGVLKASSNTVRYEPYNFINSTYNLSSVGLDSTSVMITEKNSYYTPFLIATINTAKHEDVDVFFALLGNTDTASSLYVPGIFFRWKDDTTGTFVFSNEFDETGITKESMEDIFRQVSQIHYNFKGFMQDYIMNKIIIIGSLAPKVIASIATIIQLMVKFRPTHERKLKELLGELKKQSEAIKLQLGELSIEIKAAAKFPDLQATINTKKTILDEINKYFTPLITEVEAELNKPTPDFKRFIIKMERLMKAYENFEKGFITDIERLHHLASDVPPTSSSSSVSNLGRYVPNTKRFNPGPLSNYVPNLGLSNMEFDPGQLPRIVELPPNFSSSSSFNLGKYVPSKEQLRKSYKRASNTLKRIGKKTANHMWWGPSISLKNSNENSNGEASPHIPESKGERHETPVSSARFITPPPLSPLSQLLVKPLKKTDAINAIVDKLNDPKTSYLEKETLAYALLASQEHPIAEGGYLQKSKRKHTTKRKYSQTRRNKSKRV